MMQMYKMTRKPTQEQLDQLKDWQRDHFPKERIFTVQPDPITALGVAVFWAGAAAMIWAGSALLQFMGV